MKAPDIKPTKPYGDLAGDGQSSWVEGRNCVYSLADSTGAYRVSVRTQTGWKSFGVFNDIEVAAYVANVAILTEDCVEQYQLNQVGQKDRVELTKWRQTANHAVVERLARDRFEEVQAALELLRIEEEARRKELELQMRKSAEEAYQESNAKRERIQQEQEQQAASEAAQLRNVPTSKLLDMLQRDIPGSQSRAIRAALKDRGFVRGAI